VSHFRVQCKHGILVEQCRCPGPPKSIEIVSCLQARCQQSDSDPMIPDSEIRRIAEAIILSHTEDIEWLSIAEMTSDKLEAAEWPIDSVDEEEAIWHRVDSWISKAKITITFED
jgi:hypothetical protein